MKKKIVLTFIITAFTLLSITIFASGTSQEDLNNSRDELKEIQDRIDRIEEQLKEDESNLVTTLDKISSVQNKIYLEEEKIDILQKEIDIYDVKRFDKEIEIQELEKVIDKRETDMGSRIRVMYKTDSLDYIRVLANSENFDDLLKRAELMSKVLGHDKEILFALKEDKEKLDIALFELEDILFNLNNSKADLVATRDSLAENKAILEAQKANLQASIENAEQGLKDLENQEKQVEKEIQDKLDELASQGVNISGDGIYTWPVPSSGRITSPYGYRTHPIYGSTRFHAGIDIGAPSGKPVVAADDGKVIKVVYSNVGYGNYIIIYHGNNMTTRYAHNRTLLVNEGDMVTEGQTIAEIGTSGASTGPHLHFEVRLNNKTQNPLNYVSN